VFSPRKFCAAAVATIGGDLFSYLDGGQQHADYYLGADGTPTNSRVELHGRLVQRLGITTLDCASFEWLAAGRHPTTGERLVQTSHVPTTTPDPATGKPSVRGGFHVPGIDCNLSPPKSVSALLPFMSAKDRAELERAHLAAVRVTLAELEQRVAMCRPTIDSTQVHATGELAIAAFSHHTSRPSPEVAGESGRPPDPQLHTHAFVFNLAWCQGRFLAIDSKPLLRFAATAEAIYTCELAAQLHQLGYRLDWLQTRRGRTFELAGVDRRVIELFSSRHRHIQTLARQFQLARGRPPTPLERRRLAAWDRHAKTPACRIPHWPPTSASCTSTGSHNRPRSASGSPHNPRRCPNGRPPSTPDSSARTGSPTKTPPSRPPPSSAPSTTPPPACWTPPRHERSSSDSRPAPT
jgi:conjugative relaxase-like TrwC/TraI family protein